MNLLLDMNLSPAWVDFFVTAGFKAIHWSDLGQANAPDAVLMNWAVEHCRGLGFRGHFGCNGREAPKRVAGP
jgi:hypothetical protein